MTSARLMESILGAATLAGRAATSAMLCMFGLFLAIGTSGCGGGDNDTIPTELVATYRTTLEASDLPANPPPELEDGGRDWSLTVAASGGPGNGPTLIIDSEAIGNLESPPLRVEGDHLFLDGEECFENGSYVFYDNEYSWALDGEALKIEPVLNQCRDEVALTVLTSRPWKKTS